MLKTCTKCGIEKEVTCFSVRKETGKPISQCKACVSARAVLWQKNNPDRRRQIRAKWIANNYEKMAQIRKRWKVNNPDKVNENAKKWMKAHPEVRAKNENIRRTRITKAGGKFTAEQINDMYRAQEGKCNICRNDLHNAFCRDHILPVKLGGTSDISNIQLLCRPCNSRKGSKHPDSFQHKGHLNAK